MSQPVLEDIPCAPEKNVHPSVGERSALCTARSGWCTLLFKSSVSLLIFYLVVLSMTESGISKSPTIILKLFFPNSISISFIHCRVLLLFIHVYNCHIFLRGLWRMILTIRNFTLASATANCSASGFIICSHFHLHKRTSDVLKWFFKKINTIQVYNLYMTYTES